MEAVISDRILEKEREKKKRKTAILLSLIAHLFVLNVIVFLPHKNYVGDDDFVKIDWMQEVPKERLRRMQVKPKVKPERVLKPDQLLARTAKLKKAETPKNKLTEVKKWEERLLLKNADQAKLSEKIPDLMTDAKLKDAEASNLSRLVTRNPAIGGRGKVTGRDRIKGQRSGMDIVDSYGDSEEGLLGGGGNPGVADPLGIIDFLGEFGGPQDVVFCLDVSASMQAAGLQKLEIAISSIKDSMLALGEDDKFNIVTFHAIAQSRHKTMKSADMDEIMRAMSYLDKYTPERINRNLGTNVLGAIEKSFESNPTIIVLITDGLPQTPKGMEQAFETNPKNILEEVKIKNVNQSKIFVVGLEIDLRNADAERLSFFEKLASETGGRFKMIGSEKLVRNPLSSESE